MGIGLDDVREIIWEELWACAQVLKGSQLELKMLLNKRRELFGYSPGATVYYSKDGKVPIEKAPVKSCGECKHHWWAKNQCLCTDSGVAWCAPTFVGCHHWGEKK